MIKIIRFQIKNHCLEVIIPSHSYKIPKQNLYQNLNEIEFPTGTTFIHKKIKPISDQSEQPKKTPPPQNKKYIKTKRFIPKNRRRTYQSNKTSSPKE